jgi:UDP-2,4-diacetamido-2,4,6-trideoxy-beta-L-altropyranose hydrolase
MSAPRVLFFADAGPRVGGGHVMRCLTLARALGERGAECAFVESRAAAGVLRRFGWPAGPLLALANTEDLPGFVQWGVDFAENFQPDVVVVDHYLAGAGEEIALRGASPRRIAVIDDLADRRHACDLLLDPGFGRRREDYAGLAPESAETLIGPDFALVRPEFAAARPRALSRRARHEQARRALVSLGLTDVDGITGRVVEALVPALGEMRLDVVLGSGAPSFDALSALASSDRRIRLHVDSAEMAALMADADICIGAGGSSVWERATLGLPTLSVILADNQAAMARGLAADGAGLAADAREGGFETALVDGWTRLVESPELRWALAERSSDLCDGRGADRAAAALLGLPG